MCDCSCRVLQTEGLDGPLSRIEMPLVPVLAYMETTGIAVNPTVLSEQRWAVLPGCLGAKLCVKQS